MLTLFPACFFGSWRRDGRGKELHFFNAKQQHEKVNWSIIHNWCIRCIHFQASEYQILSLPKNASTHIHMSAELWPIICWVRQKIRLSKPASRVIQDQFSTQACLLPTRSCTYLQGLNTLEVTTRGILSTLKKTEPPLSPDVNSF